MSDYCQSCWNHPGMGDTCQRCGLTNPDADRVGWDCPDCGDPMQAEDVFHCADCNEEFTLAGDLNEECPNCGEEMEHITGSEWCPLCDREDEP